MGCINKDLISYDVIELFHMIIHLRFELFKHLAKAIGSGVLRVRRAESRLKMGTVMTSPYSANRDNTFRLSL